MAEAVTSRRRQAVASDLAEFCLGKAPDVMTVTVRSSDRGLRG